MLMIYYSADHNNHDPDPQYIIDNIEQYKNIKIKITGEIKNVDINNKTLLIKLTYPLNHLILVNTRENISKAQQEDIVEAYGTLIDRTHMSAEKLLIIEQWQYYLIFFRSLPAIPFTLYLFFRTWRFNLKTYRFERRQKNA